MNRCIRIIFVLSLTLLLLFTSAGNVFASQDGLLSVIIANACNFRSGPGLSYPILMTVYKGEALADTGQSVPADGYTWFSFLGWKATTSQVIAGWLAFSYIDQYFTYPTCVTSKYALNLYSSESDNSYLGSDVPANADLYDGIRPALWLYSNLYYLKITNYYYNGRFYDLGGTRYVHTNFRTSSPSNYYLQFTLD
jgi:hypothetical protein